MGRNRFEMGRLRALWQGAKDRLSAGGSSHAFPARDEPDEDASDTGKKPRKMYVFALEVLFVSIVAYFWM